MNLQRDNSGAGRQTKQDQVVTFDRDLGGLQCLQVVEEGLRVAGQAPRQGGILSR